MSEMPVVQHETHRRAHARLRVGIAARVETLDGLLNVRLVDVSQKGAQLLVPPGTKVRRGIVSWLGFEAFGCLVWQDGDHMGVEFDEELPVEQLVETRQRAPHVVRDEAFSAERAARDFVEGKIDLGSER